MNTSTRVNSQIDATTVDVDTEADQLHAVASLAGGELLSPLGALARELSAERARLVELGGEAGDGVQALDAEIAELEDIEAAMRFDADGLALPRPRADNETTVIHGRVIGPRGPLADLAVAVTLEGGKALDFATTDKRGYFRVDLTIGREEASLRLSVSSEARALLYRDARATKLTGGEVVYREIVVDPSKDLVTPVEPIR